MNKTNQILLAIAVVAIISFVVVGVVLLNAFRYKHRKMDVKSFLENHYEKAATKMCTKREQAAWDYATDITNQAKSDKYVKVLREYSEFVRKYWGSYFKDLNVNDYKEEDVKRQVTLLKRIGISAHKLDELEKLHAIQADMLSVYLGGKICPYPDNNTNYTNTKSYTNCDAKIGLSSTPETKQKLTTSVDYDELLYIWQAWRAIFGSHFKTTFGRFVDLCNEAAVAANMKDYSEVSISSYESKTFVDDVDDLWFDVEPLYIELHKYVTRMLKKQYGDKLDVSDGLLPAHVLDNMWTEDWSNIHHLVRPFVLAEHFDANEALEGAKFTILDMFTEANEFYKSMGLLSNSISYNTSAGAIIEEPTDGRHMTFEASAWDFCDGKNYRLKMCTHLTFEDFSTVHIQMGYIQYFLQYAKQPITFRSAANPSFFEAVGRTIALAVAVPKHLKDLHLFKNFDNTNKSNLNFLMDAAISKIVPMSFALAADRWRGAVFSGQVSDTHWNECWWKYRKQYQRIKPPTEITESTLDAAAKFDVSDLSYDQKFVSHILQFQFYKSLCIAAGQYDPGDNTVPLFHCDLYNSKKAGRLLSKALQLGKSKHWSEVLEMITGSREMDASPVLEYFEPLYSFLVEENNKHDNS